MNWYLKALRQYADFKGRARRKEYWMFVLFNLIFTVIAIVLDNIFGITIVHLPYGPIYILYSLAILIPGLALAVRRLHDVGKSGWMILVSLIPIIGTIWLLILMMMDSQPMENEYGPNPKEVQVDDEKNDAERDNLIVFVVVWLFISRAFYKIVNLIQLNSDGVSDFFLSGTYQRILLLMQLVWAAIPLLLAFATKEKSKRTVLLVLGGIYLAYVLYESISNLMNTM